MAATWGTVRVTVAPLVLMAVGVTLVAVAPLMDWVTVKLPMAGVVAGAALRVTVTVPLTALTDWMTGLLAAPELMSLPVSGIWSNLTTSLSTRYSS